MPPSVNPKKDEPLFFAGRTVATFARGSDGFDGFDGFVGIDARGGGATGELRGGSDEDAAAAGGGTGSLGATRFISVPACAMR